MQNEDDRPKLKWSPESLKCAPVCSLKSIERQRLKLVLRCCFSSHLMLCLQTSC